MKVKMLPHISNFGQKTAESGIRRVIEAYFRYLPEFGVEFVHPDQESYDVLVVHAGMITDYDRAAPLVAMTHGLYWSGDYDSASWEHKANMNVIHTIRHAKEVTVPSSWVAETVQRDMRFKPHVIPHGIDWQSWQHDRECQGYVLWNKNRAHDVCSPEAVNKLAMRFPEAQFLTTFSNPNPTGNIKVTGLQPHDKMRVMIQEAAVYLATTKETFGIGILEAMAAGVPTLGFAHGGILDLIEHGVSGYLAAPGDFEDLAEGLVYCMEYWEVLGANAREAARQWTWEAVCEKVAAVYRIAAQPEKPPTVAIVIPSFQYAEWVGRAVLSARTQTYDGLTEIIVVDDSSDDDGATKQIVESLSELSDEGRSELKLGHAEVRYIRQENAGVAIARNTGIAASTAKYICCLDADDVILPEFLETVIPTLENDRSIGIAYTGLDIYIPRRDLLVKSDWPAECDFDQHLQGRNQVPTCCVFRREMWERLGGYRQRYAPLGCGTEDAEFWLRAGASGWGIKMASRAPLFQYTLGGRTTGSRDYEEADWTAWHPYCWDTIHPFASIATPAYLSHPVYQYDKPLVSVIIPVGPGHENELTNALDSLEAQTIRKWEAIVVNDSGNPLDLTPYPYVRLIETEGKLGAGYARNRGAEVARAPFLLFLDADDWLNPEEQALESMLRLYGALDVPAIIYSDYLCLAIIDEELAAKIEQDGRLLHYRADDGFAIIRHYAANYDWETAARQPEAGREYLWCNITALVPTEWHREIGGFDEQMESWEDWDYWVRMARHGKCFARIRVPLLIYKLYSSTRRYLASADTAQGLQIAQNLIQYMRDKYKGESVVPCRGCGSSSNRGRPAVVNRRNPMTATETAGSDNFVMCEYLGSPPGNLGQSQLVGAHSFSQPFEGHLMLPHTRGGWVFDYGYRGAGERFYVHKLDVQDAPHHFRPVQTSREMETMLPKRTVKRETPPPTPMRQILEEATEVVTEETAVLTGAPTEAPIETPLEAEPEVEPEVEPVVLAEQELDALVSMPTPPALAEKTNLQLLPGITPAIAEQLTELNVKNYGQILEMGIDGLQRLHGVGPAKAGSIIGAIEEMAAIRQ